MPEKPPYNARTGVATTESEISTLQHDRLKVYNKQQLAILDKKAEIESRVKKLPRYENAYSSLIKEDDIAAKEAARSKSLTTVKEKHDWKSTQISEKEFFDAFFLFMEKLTEIPLYPYQIDPGMRILRCMIYNLGEVVTLLFARQSGKTELLGQIIPTMMVLLPRLSDFIEGFDHFKKGIRIGIFAPTADQADTLFDRIKARMTSKSAGEILANPDFDIVHTRDKVIKSASIRLPNGSMCKMQTAAAQSKIESKTFDLIIIDEAQDVDEKKISKSIRPMLASTLGTLVMLGTPSETISHFYEAIQINKHRDATTVKQNHNHYEYPYTICQKYNKRYKEFVRKEALRLPGGENNEWFRMAYRLHWMFTQGMVLTEENLQEYLLNPEGGLRIGVMDKCVAGIDFGKSLDQTIVTVAQIVPVDTVDEFGNKVVKNIKYVINWLELRNINWQEQLQRIGEFLALFPGLVRVSVDATGKGEPIWELLRNQFRNRFPIEAVVLNRQRNNDLASLFDLEMWNGRIRIPANKKTQKSRRFQNFCRELLSCERDEKEGFVKFKHPDFAHAHDDYVYSLLLCLHAAEGANSQGITVVEGSIGTETFSNNVRDNSLRGLRKRVTSWFISDSDDSI